jgi:hypothetical protein
LSRIAGHEAPVRKTARICAPVADFRYGTLLEIAKASNQSIAQRYQIPTQQSMDVEFID